jgi:hypothetical protein
MVCLGDDTGKPAGYQEETIFSFSIPLQKV